MMINRRIRSFLCLLGLTSAVVRAQDPALGVTGGSGVNIHFTDPQPGELEMIRAAGFRWVRMDFSWQGTEKVRGTYDFTAYDRLLAALDQQGIRAYFILDYSNPLYESAGSVRTGEGRAAYANWVEAALTHFRHRGVLWEFWNEPNGGFWPPKADVKEYSLMVQTAMAKLETDCVLEDMTGPATSTIDLAFIDGFLQETASTLTGSISVHPYRQDGPESVAAEYAALRRVMARHFKDRPLPCVISGEWGYSSVWEGFDPDRQGRMLPRQWLVNAENEVPISIWYDWKDDGPDPKEPEHHFGTVERTYHPGRDPVFDPKPAYLAAKTYNETLAGCRIIKRLGTGNPSDHVLLLGAAEGRQVLALWTAGESRDVALPSDDGSFSMRSHLGSDLPAAGAEGGTLKLHLDDAVRYVLFPKGNARLAAAPAALDLGLKLTRTPEGKVVVMMENATGQGIEGMLIFEGASLPPQAVTLAATEGKGMMQVFDVPESFSLGARLEVNGMTAASVPPRHFEFAKPENLGGASVAAEGSPEAGGVFTLADGQAPEEIPGSSTRCQKLSYEFPDGWKFASVHPHGEALLLPVNGKPPAAFGMWIYGNGSRLDPRVRVTDAAGRTWQPAFPEIDWTGWKYVEARLNADTAHWGGNAPDKRRNPESPLRWDSLFLLDNPRRTSLKGDVSFTPPVAIYE